MTGDTNTNEAETGTPVMVRLTDGLGPTAWHCEWNGDNDSCGWDQWHDESDPMPEKWEGTPPDTVQPFYDAATVRRMLEGAWCAGYYDAGYTHDSAYACKMAEKCADEFLGPNVQAHRPAVAGPVQRGVRA